jgi:hypothetical protein
MGGGGARGSKGDTRSRRARRAVLGAFALSLSSLAWLPSHDARAGEPPDPKLAP